MAKEHSFDISAKADMQEIKNAIQQAQKEAENRYDFKGLVKEITLNEKAKTITVTSSSDNKLDALIDILIGKIIKRGLDPKVLKETSREDASGGTRRAVFAIVDAIAKEDAKRIVKEIKGLKLKVQAAIQGDEIRVSGKSLDDLQAVMAHLKSLDLDFPINFGNYR
ncbi:YajQ family cyclic di-GMP-binding protein [Hydrogenimonas urashimensis]|uniref:YajQ family cyclic di-GMP-binding protein n=1 Tax=Hydrogenimonas urashimensis TaxID=2740515 RepID=UPI0019167DF2|nr:YajQ family cyclic di-GMP-binding protein [Hydrogenimonas urashimensis]